MTARDDYLRTVRVPWEELLRRIEESGHCRWCYVVTRADLDAIVAAARAEVGLAEVRDRWKAEAEHQYALRASSGTLDGAWAEVERLLPEGWWMGGVQRYGGTWAAAVWGPAPAWDMARADGSTPVEALRNLAQALAARARRAGEAADDR